MRSIRRTLTVGMLCVGFVLLILALAASYLLANRVLARQFDRGLLERATSLATLLEQVGDQVELHFSDEVMPRYCAQEAPEYFEVWIGDRLLERSVSLAVAPSAAALPRTSRTHAGESLFDLDLPDGRAGRAIALSSLIHHYRPSSKADPGPALAHVVVAIARADLDSAIRGLLAGVVSLGGILVLLMTFLGARVLAHGLRPLERITGDLARMEAGETSEELLNASDLPSELVPVSERIRSLTESLRDALERESRTTASIAHELRTPVAELRAVAEVALQTPEDTQAVSQAMSECRDIAVSMQGMISTLLLIARARATKAALVREPIEIESLVRRLWSHLDTPARERGIAWELSVDEPIPELMQNEEALRAILTNLFENACSHCPAGGRAHCSLHRNEHDVAVVVRNEVQEITTEHVRHFGEPFWRGEESRSDRAHFGLGLALAQECAAIAGFKLTFRLDGRCLEAILLIGNDAITALDPHPAPTCST